MSKDEAMSLLINEAFQQQKQAEGNGHSKCFSSSICSYLLDILKYMILRKLKNEKKLLI
jgi:hypothetical protein